MEPTNTETQIDLEKLYHYSTPAGFSGILRSKSLWMTNIQYQNDIEEYKYAITLIGEILASEYPGIQPGAFGSPGIAPIYTFSLTLDNDLLSQWRGYAPDGGFCFSFNKNMLEKAIEKYGLTLAPCIYDLEKQKEYVRTNIVRMQPQEFREMVEKAEAVSYDRSTPEGYAYYSFMRSKRLLGGNLSYHAPRFKHPKFKQEEEWRLIKNISPQPSVSIEIIPKFREAKDIIVPYSGFVNYLSLSLGLTYLRHASLFT